ncbi:MAG TPA: PhoU domain-containing protein [Bacteroidales bacterium]|jgi:phosphate transport system protein|nr:PhoU domain-containing protein [Bacteroidales bacterium]
MSTKKEQSIQDTTKSFQEMADLILLQLNLIEKVMLSADEGENNRIINEINRNEKEIDRLEVVISDKFINSIVLYQPLASDLRKLISIYRMTINLERIGDLVMNITYAIVTISKTGEYRIMSDVILNMFQSGRVMVEKSLLSFVNNDQDYAIWTIKNDAVVDEMNNKLIANSISKANIDKKTKEMLLSYIDIKNIITNIERIADHATNIAEATIYSLQGTDIRHSDFEK